ncbi:hypothetical protein TDMWS_04120 [Thermodesulfomicrobium sp. WS]|nr:hypothetical protein TDMWS_04120 [Thermodesulfomicrobium sp. WS]
MSRQAFFPESYPQHPKTPRLFWASPQSIDATGPWLVWSEAPSPELAASLARSGVLSPILVDASQEPVLLVDGLGRLRAGHDQVLCLDVGPLSPQGRLECHLAANFHKPRTEARLVTAARSASTLGMAWDDTLALLAVHPHSKTARLLAAWLALPASWDQWIVRGHACLTVAPILAKLPPDDLTALTPVVAAYAWSQASLAQLVSWLQETAQRTEQPLRDLVSCLGIEAAGQLSPKDAMARILEAARRLRYPELCRLEEAWHAAAKSIGLPRPWRMERTDQFETGHVELRLRVTRPEDVAAAAKALERCARHPGWAALMEIGA